VAKILKNNKPGSIFLGVAAISLLIIVVCRVYIYFMLEKSFFTNFGELLYFVCYVLVYVSILTFLISAIILIIRLVRKSKN